MVKYIPEICPYKDDCPPGGVCKQVNSIEKYICAFPFDEKKIDIIKKWNESIKKIPQIDKYRLMGINNWYIDHDFRMVPKYVNKNEFKDEAIKLISAGFNLSFNREYGIGNIVSKEDGFVIQLWENKKKIEINKKTLEEVLNWIIFFYNNGQINSRRKIKIIDPIIEGLAFLIFMIIIPILIVYISYRIIFN